jgi:hypothetical protein
MLSALLAIVSGFNSVSAAVMTARAHAMVHAHLGAICQQPAEDLPGDDSRAS